MGHNKQFKRMLIRQYLKLRVVAGPSLINAVGGGSSTPLFAHPHILDISEIFALIYTPSSVMILSTVESHQLHLIGT